MKRGRKKCPVNVPLMFALWNDSTIRTEDVALQLQLSTPSLRRVASKHGLTHRVSKPSGEISDAPSAAEELLSQDSLALSPWVAKRAEQFRRQKERDGEPVSVTRTNLLKAGQRALV